jgi:glutamyl-tRNA synthetase
LTAILAAFESLESFNVASTEAALRMTAEARGVKAATLIHAVRVSVTGKVASPGLFEVLALLGRDLVRSRLTTAIALSGSVAS